VPVARLTEIFRQASESQIVTAAYAINQGRMPVLNKTENLGDTYRTLNEQLQDPAFLRLLTEEQYQQLLQKRAAMEADMAKYQLERTELQKQYAEQEEKILRLQEAQRKLDIIGQQIKLMELAEKYGLDVQDILGDLKRGAETSAEDWMTVMADAMQRVIQKIYEMWGVASPSQVMMDLGKRVMEGFASGIAKSYALPAAAMAPMIAAPSKYAALTAPSGPAMTLNFGETTINNGMDQAIFEARVLQAVRRGMRGW
jgi:hypothetical protein